MEVQKFANGQPESPEDQGRSPRQRSRSISHLHYVAWSFGIWSYLISAYFSNSATFLWQRLQDVLSLILSVVEIHPAIAIHVFQLTVYEGWKKFAIQVQSFAVETSKPDIW